MKIAHQSRVCNPPVCARAEMRVCVCKQPIEQQQLGEAMPFNMAL